MEGGLGITRLNLSGESRALLLGMLAVLVAIIGSTLAIVLWPEGAGGGGSSALVPEPALAAGGLHTCVVNDASLIECWGENADGQFGTGDFERYRSPALALGIAEAVAVTAAERHTCALTAEGLVYCWGGLNANGEIGDGTFLEGRTLPARVALLEDVVQIDAGQFHTCAVTNDGAAYCWGSNGDGQIGNGSGAQRPELLPQAVVGLESGVVAVSAGGRSTCALLEDGTVQCWGSNALGQLGNGRRGDTTEPVSVLGLDGDELLSDVLEISSGWGHTCALIDGGDIVCWGLNDFGQVGNGEAPFPAGGIAGSGGGTPADGVDVPVRVERLAGPAASVSAGGFHTCALLEGGRVQCWGANDVGQLGFSIEEIPEDESLLPGLVPVDVDRLPEASVVSAGYYHTCALTEIGVMCWGEGFGFIAQVVPDVLVKE